MIKNVYKYFRNEFYKLKWKSKHVRFLENSKIDRACVFEGDNSIGSGTTLSNCIVGRGTYIARQGYLTHVLIGRLCSIGSNVKNITGNHPTSKFVSTHPAFFSVAKQAGFTFSDKSKFTELKYITEKYLLEIGNDVWIGDNVTIMDGIKVGDGAIIGANSLVTKNIEPYSINVGIPSKVIKYRFENDEIEFLLKTHWWTKDWSWLADNWESFESINEMKKLLK